MKKFVSLFLALIMAMALAVPAFAAAPAANTESSTTQNTSMNATTKGLEIKLKVNATAAITFNPYKMQIEVNGNTTNDQIVSPAVFIQSQTKIPLTIDATVTGAPDTDSGVTFNGATTVGATGGGKKVFVVWEIMKASDGETEPKWTAVDKASKALQTSATDDDKKDVPIGSMMIVKSTAGTKKGVYTMPAAGDDPVYAAFHVAGDAVANPATSSAPATWTDKDTFKVTVALTFNPDPDATT